MRSLYILAFSLLFITGCSDAIDSAQGEFALQTRNALEILPADIDMAGMVNIQAARQAGFFDRSDSPFSADNLDGENAARFNEFMRLTGFNPEEDVRRVYIAASDNSQKLNQPAFVVYADFDRTRIEAYLDENMPQDVARTTYNDVPVYLLHEEEGTFGFGILNNEMAIAGTQSELHAMIDRVTNGTTGLAGNQSMMELIQRASHPDDAWFAVREMRGDMRDEGHGDIGPRGIGRAASLMDSGVISFGFSGEEVEMTAYGVPRSAASTSDVVDLIKGALALARTTTADENPEMAAMLERVDVRETSGTVRVHTTINNSFFQEISNKHN